MNKYVLLFSIMIIFASTIAGPLSDLNPTTGLSISETGSRLTVLMYDEKPLPAFGCHFEHMLFDDYDFKEWTQWSVDHGMNHCRVRLYHA